MLGKLTWADIPFDNPIEMAPFFSWAAWSPWFSGW